MTNATMEKPRFPAAEKGDTRKVLFVCTGNTCRSPMAAAVLNELARPRELCSVGEGEERRRFAAFSAGLAACPGDPITPAAVAALAAAGIPDLPSNHYTAHVARPVSESMLDAAHMVVAITGRHAMELMMRYPACAGKITTLGTDIADPFGGDETAYRACLAALTHGIREKFFGGDGI